ncbi:coiled-coil domain-containing protein 174 [Aedes albopictus]|uniref:CCDC174 alpha/beta GRSR domain-containing protein n=1 Tax=Aedes albopictus TaxID=7160 RepID=A0ABM1ZC00_AEDAL
MNDPNRKIDIDKSSLLSLKAELLRKQEEVSRAKAFTSIDDFVPKKVPKPEKPPGSSSSSSLSSSKRKNDKPASTIIELEDSAELIRSKQILESKAKYYDRMVASGGSLNSDENCLVMFNQKKQTDKPVLLEDARYSSSDGSVSSEEDEPSRRPRIDATSLDGDWVEYTDFLGRSRKCRRKELEDCLRRDREMARDAKRDGAGNDRQADDDEDDGELIGPPVPSMAITEDTIGDRFREMREQWAKQEAENLDKDSVHYQDVLFDEARQHGVGYYAFSTDREERNRQQQELDSIRDATLEAQKEREDLRKARDKIIADRMKAAKARQRVRQGLPPEEEKREEAKPESEKEPQQQSDAATTDDALYDTSEERKRLKAEAKAQRKKEKEERKRDRERQKHVRPWDEGKHKDEEMEWKPAREWHVMSQEEWNEMKRKERIDEFAPPVDYAPKTERRRNVRPPTYYEDRVGQPNDRDAADDNDGNNSEEDENEQIGPLPTDRFYNSSRAHSTANNPLLPSSVFYGGGGAAIDEDVVSMPTIPGTEDDIVLPEETNRTLFFTTKKNKKEFKRRNYDASLDHDAGSEKRFKPQQQQQAVPIRNELSDGESEDDRRESSRRGAAAAAGEGAEIPPPPTFEYYGPSSAAVRQNQQRSKAAPVSKNALEASIEAGLRFLREQSDKGGPSTGTKNKWTSNADY